MGQIIIFLGILLLIDLYIFQAVRTVSESLGPIYKGLVYGAYWMISALTLALFFSAPYLRSAAVPNSWRIYPLAIGIGVIIAKLLSLGFFLMDDLRRILQWAWYKIQSGEAAGPLASGASGEGISRSTFLSWIGLGVGGTIFSTLLYGFKNQYNYQVRELSLAFPHLPSAFRGLRIIHISDIHSGSFMNKDEVLRGIRTINDLKPDLILFTGDLVNDRASEMAPYMDVFSQLSAPMGVYSVLGNHDYGDYIGWESPDAKVENLEKLKTVHASLGWKLLLDESVSLQKGGDSIGLIGVQNISGKARFHSYGDLAKAYRDTADAPFKILMSHDPSHWDAEVKKQYPDIDLTLSGHTHGMQFGVELPWFKWSPVQWVYRQWAGLYEDAGQKLYVNRGFGFIGYPGRVGILPEITLIELV
ncbi:MAG TPA: metallophosphoesterase [Phnomibacter sp.]|nr:metallophosphoesterase [Phnomibacter sp.]